MCQGLPTTPVAGPRLLVIARARGSGSKPLLQRLLADFPNKIEICVPRTTRAKKKGKIHGKEFYYTTMEDLQREISADKYLEWVNYTDAMYGTSATAVKCIQSKGKICLLEMDDLKRVQSIKERADPYLVFIQSPSETDEMESSDIYFDLTIVNDNEEKAYKRLKEALTAESTFSEILTEKKSRSQDIQQRIFNTYQVMKNYAIVLVLATILGVYVIPLEF